MVVEPEYRVEPCLRARVPGSAIPAVPGRAQRVPQLRFQELEWRARQRLVREGREENLEQPLRQAIHPDHPRVGQSETAVVGGQLVALPHKQLPDVTTKRCTLIGPTVVLVVCRCPCS